MAVYCGLSSVDGRTHRPDSAECGEAQQPEQNGERGATPPESREFGDDAYSDRGKREGAVEDDEVQRERASPLLIRDAASDHAKAGAQAGTGPQAAEHGR